MNVALADRKVAQIFVVRIRDEIQDAGFGSPRSRELESLCRDCKKLRAAHIQL